MSPRVKKIAFSFLILMLATALYPARAATERRLDFLLRFFDLNEAASAYHRHCLSTTEALNPKFSDTMEYVADELYNQGIRVNPKMKPEHVQAMLMQRRYHLQYRLDEANMKEGCDSRDSRMAKGHYLEFSRFKRAEVRRFIDENTN